MHQLNTVPDCIPVMRSCLDLWVIVKLIVALRIVVRRGIGHHVPVGSYIAKAYWANNPTGCRAAARSQEATYSARTVISGGGLHGLHVSSVCAPLNSV
ncbi:hypothetical protein PCANC_24006 [Puccinia coronata f. sp. avenae]|uniref:Uncharacterized protein n=1 Tax=Puccinia coronata f. sp. avenae TaxID=200324 RepID=A0A2N5TX36_9BASI|nr:hypothetical protein PCANC_24006 [Puccinia coronata f. sp. avenae]